MIMLVLLFDHTNDILIEQLLIKNIVLTKQIKYDLSFKAEGVL